MTTPIDFDGINAAALHNGRSFVVSLLPGGKFRSLEYVVNNPCRDDRRPGSLASTIDPGAGRIFPAATAAAILYRWSLICAAPAKVMRRAR